MKEMGWTYREYQSTPASIVDETYYWIRTNGQMQQEAQELAPMKKGKRG
jgi:hypothetical protein